MNTCWGPEGDEGRRVDENEMVLNVYVYEWKCVRALSEV